MRIFYETPEGVQSSHYFNILPDGTRWDATHQQFPKGTLFSPPLEASLDDFRAATRTHLAKKGFDGTAYAYILSFSGTCARFEKLKKCMEKSV